MDIKGIESLPVFELEKFIIKKKRKRHRTLESFLKDALNNVNKTQLQAEQITKDFTIGDDVELHQVVLATEKAALALQLTIQIRNKVIEAYQELMRMQI